MAMKVENMDMPEVCAKCPLFKKPEGQNVALFMGLPFNGQCKVLPIKDLDGNTISYQTVGTTNEIANKERSKHCPLKECK